MHTSLTAEDEMMELGLQMIKEHEDVPAGAVLRTVARATRHARAWGCPPEFLVAAVEASTRWRLAQRSAPLKV